MKAITIGVIDYGVGNHASVAHSLSDIGFRVRISEDIEHLNRTDALILPGVGAFPTAMSALKKRGLVEYLKEQKEINRPLIGICLGMQLLATTSSEHEKTDGLDLIPGEIVPFQGKHSHIGWNVLQCSKDCSFLNGSNNQAFYFNHSFYFSGSDKYKMAMTSFSTDFSSVIKNGSVVGVQFHPEKSQLVGKVLLKNLITELVNGPVDA